ncbi:hypothetical protein LRS58_20480 [Rhodococcus sp. BH2-1]|nr:hypothetical protein [Rhodococcus sp. BH2-1]
MPTRFDVVENTCLVVVRLRRCRSDRHLDVCRNVVAKSLETIDAAAATISWFTLLVSY